MIQNVNQVILNHSIILLPQLPLQFSETLKDHSTSASTFRFVHLALAKPLPSHYEKLLAQATSPPQAKRCFGPSRLMIFIIICQHKRGYNTKTPSNSWVKLACRSCRRCL
jgi:hypothetical protein